MPVLSHELQVQLPSLRRLSARVGSSASFRSAVANESVAVVVRGHFVQTFLCSGFESTYCARPCKQKGLKSLVCAFGRFYVKQGFMYLQYHLNRYLGDFSFRQGCW